MPIEFKSLTVEFSDSSSRIEKVSFSSTVSNATVALQSFSAKFPGSSSGNISDLNIGVSNVSYSDKEVSFEITFGANAGSNDYITGSVEACIIAETA